MTFSPIRALCLNVSVLIGGWCLVMLAAGAHVRGVAPADSPLISLALLLLVVATLVMLNWRLTSGASRWLRVTFSVLASVVFTLMFVLAGIPLIYWFHLAIGGA